MDLERVRGKGEGAAADVALLLSLLWPDWIDTNINMDIGRKKEESERMREADTYVKVLVVWFFYGRERWCLVVVIIKVEH